MGGGKREIQSVEGIRHLGIGYAYLIGISLLILEGSALCRCTRSDVIIISNLWGLFLVVIHTEITICSCTWHYQEGLRFSRNDQAPKQM